MRIFIMLLIGIFTSFPVFLHSQTDKVKQYLQMIGIGKINEVKSRMPDMLAIYPNDPGVMLLHGIVIEDLSKSIEIFEKIIKNFPASEFADDANYRIVQYYVLTGNINKANSELESFRARYKDSELLIIASDLLNSASKVSDSKKVTLTKEESKPEATKKDIGSKVVVEEKKTIKEEPKQKNNAAYGLQVGLYSNHEAAKSEMQKFQNQRMFAEIKVKKVDNVNYYAVIIGNYSSKESAEEAKAIVKSICKCDPIIYEKDK